jgi:hypothetical protein
MVMMANCTVLVVINSKTPLMSYFAQSTKHQFGSNNNFQWSLTFLSVPIYYLTQTLIYKLHYKPFSNLFSIVCFSRSVKG